MSLRGESLPLAILLGALGASPQLSRAEEATEKNIEKSAEKSTEKSSDEQTELPRRSLSEFLKLAETSGPELQESRAKIEGARSKIDWAESFGTPGGKLDLFVGPAPSASGNPLVGATDWSKFGLVTGAKLELIQPIYTFGAISAGVEAARSGEKAELALYEKGGWALRTSIAEYYYGFQMAFELSELASGVNSKMQEALAAGEKLRTQRGKNAPTLTDLDKLRLASAELRVRESEALKGASTAKAAMAWKTGLQEGPPLRWDQSNLKLRDTRLEELKHYQDLAQKNRPEFNALEEDANARASLARAESAQSYPMLYLAAQAQHVESSQRSEQSSPFAYDPLNDNTGALLLGIRWNLGFFERSAKSSMARAEALAAEARKRYWGAALHADIERNYLELKHAILAVGERSDASKIAKRVYQDSFVGFTLGSVSAKDFLEAIGAYAMGEKARLESVYSQNLAIYKMEQATGTAL